MPRSLGILIGLYGLIVLVGVARVLESKLGISNLVLVPVVFSAAVVVGVLGMRRQERNKRGRDARDQARGPDAT